MSMSLVVEEAGVENPKSYILGARESSRYRHVEPFEGEWWYIHIGLGLLGKFSYGEALKDPCSYLVPPFAVVGIDKEAIIDRVCSEIDRLFASHDDWKDESKEDSESKIGMELKAYVVGDHSISDYEHVEPFEGKWWHTRIGLLFGGKCRYGEVIKDVVTSFQIPEKIGFDRESIKKFTDEYPIPCFNIIRPDKESIKRLVCEKIEYLFKRFKSYGVEFERDLGISHPYWECNKCGWIEEKEAEVCCWKCGKTLGGEMIYKGVER